MQLENARVAVENAERGSALSKQQILSGFMQTKIGRLAFRDFKDGKPGQYVSITGKWKEEKRGWGRKKVVEVFRPLKSLNVSW